MSSISAVLETFAGKQKRNKKQGSNPAKSEEDKVGKTVPEVPEKVTEPVILNDPLKGMSVRYSFVEFRGKGRFVLTG